MATLNFELVSPERVLFSGEVDMVVLPATEGEITVLFGHAPTMTALTTGYLTMTIAGKATRMLVLGGFADINAEGLTVLAQRALTDEELTADIWEAELANARKAIADAKGDDAKLAAEMALAKLEEARSGLKH